MTEKERRKCREFAHQDCGIMPAASPSYLSLFPAIIKQIAQHQYCTINTEIKRILCLDKKLIGSISLSRVQRQPCLSRQIMHNLFVI